MLINGSFESKLAVNDRALCYGDGLFETIRLNSGKPVFLSEHLERLARGCHRLGINLSLTSLESDIELLSDRYYDFGVLKITISRGAGGRGYRALDSSLAGSATRILTLHSLPDYSHVLSMGGIKSFVCEQRLAHQPSLAGIKHLNRLEQVMASREWPNDNFSEGIMLDSDGYVIEGTKSNIFFVKDGILITPDLSHCGINGVMRKILLECFPDSETKIEKSCTLSALLAAGEVFVCNSVLGVWPVLSIESKEEKVTYRPASFCQRAQAIFQKALM